MYGEYARTAVWRVPEYRDVGHTQQITALQGPPSDCWMTSSMATPGVGTTRVAAHRRDPLRSSRVAPVGGRTSDALPPRAERTRWPRIDGAVRPTAVNSPTSPIELRSNLTLLILITKSVLRSPGLDADQAALLHKVIDELQADIDYLWTAQAYQDSGATPDTISSERLLYLVDRVGSCATLLIDAVTFLTIAPDQALRLDRAVSQLDDVVRDIWQSAPRPDDQPGR